MAALWVSACSADDDGDFPFVLPPHTFVFSAASPQWRHVPAGALSNDFTCGPTGRLESCCPPPGLPMFDCRELPISCEANLCALKFRLESRIRIDLPKEVLAFENVRGRVLSEVWLERLDYELAGDLSVVLPDVAVQIAPVRAGEGPTTGVTFARLPRIDQGQTKGGTVAVDKMGRKLFSDRASDFQTPFDLMLSTTLVSRPDTPGGQGRLEITVSGSGRARP